jgi:hypothetical protein
MSSQTGWTIAAVIGAAIFGIFVYFKNASATAAAANAQLASAAGIALPVVQSPQNGTQVVAPVAAPVPSSGTSVALTTGSTS